MSRNYIASHPLIKHKLALMRDKKTGTKDFRQLAEEISLLLAMEATGEFETKPVKVETPFGQSQDYVLKKETGIVAILRAGLGMVPGVLQLFPDAHIGHFGIYRDPKTLEPVEYYARYLGKMKGNNVLVVDPMLATGGTASKAITLLKKKGADSVTLICIVSSKEGLARINNDHPDVPIYTATTDPILTEKGYIKPGLGDAGDRIYGTKS